MWCLTQNAARICSKSDKQVLKLLKRQVRAKANVGIGKNQFISFPSRSPVWSDLTKPLLFTVGFSTVAMAGSAIWKYENERQKRMKRTGTYTGDFWKYFENLPPKPKAGEWRQQMNTYWNSLREGQKIVAGLLIANTAIFILWQIPAMTPFMMRYFVSSPVAHSKCIPMLLCAFSHQNFMHFGFNMYALSNFAPPVCEAMGKELFLGFYMTAAIVSSMTSLFYKVALGIAAPSLGASGALFGVLGVFGTLFPESRMSIIFLPMYTFTAEQGITGLALFDFCGMIFRLGFLDHAAHLGGLVFGVLWMKEGFKLLTPVIQKWHEERNKKQW